MTTSLAPFTHHNGGTFTRPAKRLWAIAFGLVCQLAFLSAPVSATSPSSAADRQASWRQHQQLAEESAFKDLKWRSVGPRLQGGRIETIAVDPTNPSVIYVGAGSGNLWKTVNNGTTWKPIFEHESTFAMGEVAVSPSNPDILWLGTGERLMARSSYAGTGIFKSTDGGETWRNMGLADSHHIGRVIVDPKDPDIVFAAVIGHLYSPNEERGVFKTADGGKTWSKVLYIDDRTGAIDLVMHPKDPQVLYATTWEHDRKAWGHTAYGKGCGLYKTTDAGKTWRRLTKGLPVEDQVGRLGVDVSRSNPDVVYAIADCQGDAGGVFRSADAGETWMKVNRDEVKTGYDFCVIRVSPDNENEIYVPGQCTMRSTDGGKSYTQIKGTLVHLLDHGSKILHLDAHAFWIDPKDPNHLILGNDGGLHFSYDRGQSWLHMNNLPIGEFYAVWADMAVPYNIYGGTQDNAALYGPSTFVPQPDGKDEWHQVYLDPWGGGDSFFTYPDPTDASTIYYENQFGDLYRKNMAARQTKNIWPRAPRGEPGLRYNWMTPFVISRHNPWTLYYGANRLFKSVNRGDQWAVVSPDLSTQPGPEKQGNVPYGTITTIAESTFVPGVLYVGTDDGYVHLTRNDGQTWTRINEGLPDKWVSRLEVSPHDKARVYVSLSGCREDDCGAYVFSSPDYGKTWISIGGNLPAESINVIREDPAVPGLLYVGTDLGVYVSLDRGQKWHSLCNHLPTTPAYDLFVHSRDHELICGTHGRSVFVLDVKPIQEQAKKENQT